MKIGAEQSRCRPFRIPRMHRGQCALGTSQSLPPFVDIRWPSPPVWSVRTKKKSFHLFLDLIFLVIHNSILYITKPHTLLMVCYSSQINPIIANLIHWFWNFNGNHVLPHELWHRFTATVMVGPSQFRHLFETWRTSQTFRKFKSAKQF